MNFSDPYRGGQGVDDVFGNEPLNQSPPYTGRNLFATDPLLVALSGNLSPAAQKDFIKIGDALGTAESFQLADLANRNKPILKTHNERGKRIDRVEFHPSYHALLRRGVSYGLQGSVWEEPTANKMDVGHHHQARAVRFFLTSQVECGHLCPLTMTNAAPAALRHSPRLAADWLPKVKNRTYDSTHKSPFEKKGITFGMGMTEKQGGTDVRANLTRAQAVNSDLWSITGHKWFLSAPMSDAFLVLAQAPGGLSCFLIPRMLPDGKMNNLRFQRLKDKLGNSSNASSEVEFNGTLGFLIGADGHGIRTILEMATLTRLDCAVASAGIMRSSLAHAVHHARHRSSFQKKLIDQPLQTRVLADLALDCGAATVLSMRLAESFDRAPRDETEAAFSRLMTPVVKYWVCKATPPFVTETMECLGGNGYIEDWPMARFYREAPVNAIWEGSGNVMCLDVLRALRSNPQTLDAVLLLVEAAFGSSQNPLLDVVRKAASAALKDEGSARIFTEQLALTVMAAELRRIARSDIADAFLESRLSRPYRTTYGMLDSRFDSRAILDAMYPAV